MSTVSGKTVFLRILFIAYFIIYANSSLSYALPPDRAAMLQKESDYSATLNVFLLDLICSHITEADQADVPANRLLIKKLRAVIRANIKPDLPNAENKLGEKTLSLIIPEFYTEFQTLDDTVKPQEQFLTRFSGLSPPLFLLS